MSKQCPQLANKWWNKITSWWQRIKTDCRICLFITCTVFTYLWTGIQKQKRGSCVKGCGCMTCLTFKLVFWIWSLANRYIFEIQSVAFRYMDANHNAYIFIPKCCCQNQDHLLLGSRDSSVVQCWTPDQKVTGLRPSRSMNIFFSSNQFSVLIHFSLCSILMLLQWYVKLKGCDHPAQSEGGKLYLNTHQWHAPYMRGFKQVTL